MIYQNFYDNPNMLINAIGNYIPYIIKVKLYNQKESNWLQNKPYYSIIFNEYFVVNNQRFLIKDIEKISFKTKNEKYGKNQYDFLVSSKYFQDNDIGETITELWYGFSTRKIKIIRKRISNIYR